MSERIEGFVIEGKGGFLSAGGRWLDVPVPLAYVHTPNTIGGIRKTFRSCQNKPQRMYRAVKNTEGRTLLLIPTPLAFDEGIVIEGRPGNFLEAGSYWREGSVQNAHVYVPDAAWEIRDAFHFCQNKPQRMYRAAIDDKGKTALLVTNPVTFYPVSGSDRRYVGDCAQLTTT